jgi:hypothetical protein
MDCCNATLGLNDPESKVVRLGVGMKDEG